MYYWAPEQPQAYSYKDQYFFGSQMIVSPIVAPMDNATQLSTKAIWLPEVGYKSIVISIRFITMYYYRCLLLNDYISVFIQKSSVIQPSMCILKEFQIIEIIQIIEIHNGNL